MFRPEFSVMPHSVKIWNFMCFGERSNESEEMARLRSLLETKKPKKALKEKPVLALTLLFSSSVKVSAVLLFVGIENVLQLK